MLARVSPELLELIGPMEWLAIGRHDSDGSVEVLDVKKARPILSCQGNPVTFLHSKVRCIQYFVLGFATMVMAHDAWGKVVN